MVTCRSGLKQHPDDIMISGLLDGSLNNEESSYVKEHVSKCDECLIKLMSAHETVSEFRSDNSMIKRMGKTMKKINIYLVLSAAAFALSFIMPRYFIQMLAAALILGMKWVADSKSAKMLVMIYDAWRSGGEKEASRVIKTLEKDRKFRL